MGLTKEIAAGAPGLSGLEEMIDPRAEDARGLQPEERCELGDHVGEESIEKEENDQDPFQSCVY